MKISDVTVRRFDMAIAVPDIAIGHETLVVEVRTDEGVFLKTPLLPGFGLVVDEEAAERILIKE